MKHSDASALLLVLSMVIILIATSYQVWQVASLRIDVEHQREIYYRHFYLADGILNSALEVASKNFDQIFKSKVLVELDISSALLSEKTQNKTYTALAKSGVIMKKGKLQPNVLLVCVSLLKAGQNVFVLRCLLNKNRFGQKVEYSVSSYSIGYGILF